MLISVFFLDRAHNTHRWIHFSGFSFQPSEVAKVAIILFLAFFLESRINAMNDWRNTLLPAVLPTLMFLALIVFQPDLGTAIACAAITACILFVAGLDLRWLGYAGLASLLPLYFLIFHVAYRRDRILAFPNPSDQERLSHYSVTDAVAPGVPASIHGGQAEAFYPPAATILFLP
jgi:cell division protein FtsW